MKKLIAGILFAILVLSLAACGTKDAGTSGQDTTDAGETTDVGEKAEDNTQEEATKLVVGASNTPHAIILEEAKPLLEEKGIELEIETYQDYVLPNKDLEAKALDANYFQHIPYMEGQMADFGYEFVNAGAIHIEPIGVYSKNIKALKNCQTAQLS